MGFSNLANSMIVSPLPYLLAVVAMIWWGHSSDKSGERIWHIVLPVLLAILGFVLGAASSSDIVVLIGITLVIIGLDAVIGPFWSLPSSFLRGPAAAGGIALINTFGTGAGGFIGPYVIGQLRGATGGYSASMAVLAIGLLFTCAIVLAFSRTIAPRPVTELPR
jgi:ACS family tartrate transporter-like MFS transporter